MTHNALLKFIRESRALLKTASPEQKIRILQLIKEGLQKIQETKTSESVILTENPEVPQDYIQEK
jgi:hypothetical protein